MTYETEKLEFKITDSDKIYKSVIAFANTEGGMILVGVANSGEIEPLPDIDDVYTRITNGIRDGIAPDVTIFVKYTLENEGIIRIEISEGSYKPYYLKANGLKPSGVYVRQGASSVQASPEKIREMIKYADGDVFEELRSIEQKLTFLSCTNTFKSNGLEFGEGKFKILGIHNKGQGLYTNLGLLLSDQCPYSIKIAVFSDEQNTVFRDRKEFTGSVFTQMDEAFAYLQICNQNRSVIDGLTRTDHWDYPQEAIREALINALIHRDYSYSGPIIINVNEKYIEFISIGGLLPGLLPEDIRSGISQLRNRNLAEIFHRLHFIEAYGTGIRRILSLYTGYEETPDIVITTNSFKITLPNTNYAQERRIAPSVTTPVISPQMRTILDCVGKNPRVSDGELQQILGIKRTRLYALISQMKRSGFIDVSGRGKEKIYLIKYK